MNTSEKDKVYKAGYDAGKKHSTMSEETKGCINNITNNISQLERQIDDVKEKVEKLPTRDEMELSNRRLAEEIIRKADKRYADKRTEKLVNYLVGGIFLLGLAIILTTLFGQQLPIDIGI